MRILTKISWLLAVPLLIAAIVVGRTEAAPVPRSAVVAPTIDIVIPTDTWNEQCLGGAPPPETLCRTDNATVYYYMDSHGEFELETADRNAVEAALARYDNLAPTIIYDPTPVFEGGGETDFIFQEGDFGYPDQYTGIAWCNDPENGTRHLCDQHYIRIRGNGNYDEDTAGHEAGHAFGMSHGAQASPVQTQCAAVMGIMRALESCRTNALGDLVRDNINWVY